MIDWILLKKSQILITILILILFASAFGKSQDADVTPVVPTPSFVALEDTYLLDPIFNEFYEFLGGMNTLGPAITPLIESGNLKTQYLDSGLMVFDPQAKVGERFRMAPLGLVFGVSEPAVRDPGPPSEYRNGHVISTDFLPLYTQLGGAQFVGSPLTEARYNPDKARIEQYFENLGFYVLDSDQIVEVQLLAYGAFACDQQCRYQPPQASIPSLKPVLPEPFASKASRLGLPLIGKTLTEAYLTYDGKLEVIFENIVLVIDPSSQDTHPTLFFPNVWLPLVMGFDREKSTGEDIQSGFRLWLPEVRLTIPGGSTGDVLQISFQLWLPSMIGESLDVQDSVYLRPIVEMVGIQPQSLVNDMNDPLVVFYPIEGDNGHNVPVHFDNYLKRYGGLDISGPPITEVYQISYGVFRQCFTNLCLDFEPSADEDRRLRLSPLGSLYKEQYYDQSGVFVTTQLLDDIDIKVWESKPFVPSDEYQEIHVMVTKNGIPLENRGLELILTIPDNSQMKYHFPPTDDKGQTSLPVAPISAPVGTLIAYEVCIPGVEGDEVCVGDNYLIWKSP